MPNNFVSTDWDFIKNSNFIQDLLLMFCFCEHGGCLARSVFYYYDLKMERGDNHYTTAETVSLQVLSAEGTI